MCAVAITWNGGSVRRCRVQTGRCCLSAARAAFVSVLGISAVSLCGASVVSAQVGQPPVEMRGAIGAWSLYCTSNTLHPTIRDCSLLNSVVAENDPSDWVKLGLAFASVTGDITLTVRTPRLNFFKKGISVAADGRQVGRAFVESCGEAWCQTMVKVEANLLKAFGSSSLATFEYPVSADESVALTVPLDGFVKAIGELRSAVGLSPAVASLPPARTDQPSRLGTLVGSSPLEYTLQMKTVPSDAPTTQANLWGEPLRQCLGEPASKDVKVTSDLEIFDNASFDKWLAGTKACSPYSVLWISRKQPDQKNLANQRADELGFYAVYQAVKDSFPKENIVFTSDSGVPVSPTSNALRAASPLAPTPRAMDVAPK